MLRNDDSNWFAKATSNLDGLYKELSSAHTKEAKIKDIEDGSKGISLSEKNVKIKNRKLASPEIEEKLLDTVISQDKLIKPLGQVLAEIVIGKDEENKNELRIISDEEIENFRELEKDKDNALIIYKEKYKNNKPIATLIKKYREIVEYKKKFANFTKGDIKQWVKQNSASCSDEEFIACLNKAYQLKEEGEGNNFSLRDTQILSLLIFLNAVKGRGQLCQISTGEGKTIIVAMLAIIKACRGETVDVMTSNEVLAEEGVTKMSKLYNMFNLTVKTNNAEEGYLEGAKDCYKANVVYGCISNFQFDYLRDTFEGLKTRANRQFGAAILDEVDSLVIDNGSHIAKLSGPLPGMDYFRYIYINIWDALCKLDGLDLESIKKNLIKQKESFVPTELIPGHLLDFAHQSLERWIKNAIYARHHCQVDKQYVLKQKEGEWVVTPVDYANTGVTLNETIWSHGLHQFVQLNHGVYLTPENLTSSFISNLGYVNKYHNNIYGLTGTLGSVNEQSLLSGVYLIDYAKIPTFKNKQFMEISGIVSSDDTWMQTILDEICNKSIQEKRAVLVIAETIHDAKTIKAKLEHILSVYYKGHSVTIKDYIDEEKISKAQDEKMDIGHIAISTNIAGRGTDLSTSKSLEQNGGLHVCVGFLPTNKRVEDQAFGRTSRQGNRGTAQLIIRRSEIANQSDSIKNAKIYRDLNEQKRIQKIRMKKLHEIQFDDEIFSLFSELYSTFKKDNKNDPVSYFLCSDLKEWWAFFLEELALKDKHSLNAKVAFDEFYTHEKTQKIIKDKLIAHNPYYGIQLAEHWMRNQNIGEAKNSVDKACDALDNSLEIAGKSQDLLYSLYLKYFELCIEKWNAIQQRLNEAIGHIFLIPVKTDDTYKAKAIENLKIASKSIKKEIEYISINRNSFNSHLSGRLVTLNVFEKNITDLINQLSGVLKEEQPIEIDQDKIIEEIKNEIPNVDLHEYRHAIRSNLSQKELDQIIQTLIRNRLHQEGMKSEDVEKISQQIENKIKKMDNKKNTIVNSNKDALFVIASRKSDYFDRLDEKDENQKSLKGNINKKAISELVSIGLENIYGLKQIYKLDDYPVHVATGEMMGGIMLEAAAQATNAFPLVSKPLDIAAGTLITESICGLVSELFNSEEKFDKARYERNKLISYAVSLGIAAGVGGIGAVANKAQLVSKSKFEFIKKMDTLFKNNKLIKNLKIKFPPHPKVKLLGKIGNAAEAAALSQVMEKVASAGLKDLLKSLKPALTKNVRPLLEAHIKKDILENISKDIIVHASTEIIAKENDSAVEVAKQIAQGVGTASVQALNANNWKATIGGRILEMMINNIALSSEATHYTEKYCLLLNDELSKKETAGKVDDIHAILSILVEHVVEKIYSSIVEIITNILRAGVVDPIVVNAHRKFAGNVGTKKTSAETSTVTTPIPISVKSLPKTSTIIPNELPKHDSHTPASIKPSHEEATLVSRRKLFFDAIPDSDNSVERKKQNRQSMPHSDISDRHRSLLDLDVVDKKRQSMIELRGKQVDEASFVHPIYNDMKKLGSTGPVLLAKQVGDLGYEYSKIVTYDIKNKTENTTYYDKTGAMVDIPKNIDISKIPSFKCEVQQRGELSHFTSADFDITVPYQTRNCAQSALLIEHARLQGKTRQEIQNCINKNPEEFHQLIEQKKIEASEIILNTDSDTMRKNVQNAKNNDAFHPGHGFKLKNGKPVYDGSRPTPTNKNTVDILKRKHEEVVRDGEPLPINKKTGAFAKKAGLSANHEISDHNIQKMIGGDLLERKNGANIKQLIDVFSFKDGHEDEIKIKKLFKDYTDSPQDIKRQTAIANEMITIFSQHEGQISYGNAIMNSTIKEAWDPYVTIKYGKHSFGDSSRYTLEKLALPENDEARRLITPPIVKNGVMYSSHYAPGGEKNKHAKDVDLNNLSPGSEKLFFDAFPQFKP